MGLADRLLRLYAGRRLAWLESLDPVASQRRTLARLLRRAAHTRFGRDHGFGRIEGPEEFARAVPIRDYEQMAQDYWRAPFPLLDNISWPGRVPFFALSSGTTSATSKSIPVTWPMVRANRLAALDILVLEAAGRQDFRPLSGKSFLLGGSTDLERPAKGVLVGDLSGIAAVTTPRWARGLTWPPQELALISDWDEKLTRLAIGGRRQRITTISGLPSWLLILLERMVEPGAPLLPDLQLLIHGGVTWQPYADRFAALFGDRSIPTREVYPASEGFIAIADRGSMQGLRLLCDHGLFFEFVPVAELDSARPTRHWLATIETGVDYAIVLSSCAGLWAYAVGDTVRFVDRSPPRLFITGRTSYMLSAFGEHLLGAEIDRAVGDAAAAVGVMLAEYSVGPVMPDRPGVLGHHVFIVELDHSARIVSDLAGRLAGTIDRRLADLNDDYRAHRAGMAAPTVRLVPPGSFAAWLDEQGKAGGQHKVPRVLRDPDRFGDLTGWLDRQGIQPGSGGE